jgi:hypothetical protein
LNNSIVGRFGNPPMVLTISAVFPFGEEKLVAPLIAIPNVDKQIEDKRKAKS